MLSGWSVSPGDDDADTARVGAALGSAPGTSQPVFIDDERLVGSAVRPNQVGGRPAFDGSGLAGESLGDLRSPPESFDGDTRYP
jgi:hypothetical protein